MVKYLLSLICPLFLLLACSLDKHTDTCNQFKNGYFLYRYKSKDAAELLIIRKDSIQFEINEQTNDTTELSIVWTGNCMYDLRYKSSTVKGFSDSIQDLRKKTVIHNEIISHTDSYYIFKSLRVNSDYLLMDTLWVEK